MGFSNIMLETKDDMEEIQVMLCIYSGVPNPYWIVTSGSPIYQHIKAKLDKFKNERQSPVLGYTGFLLFVKSKAYIQDVPENSDCMSHQHGHWYNRLRRFFCCTRRRRRRREREHFVMYEIPHGKDLAFENFLLDLAPEEYSEDVKFVRDHYPILQS